jgi:RNA polymerase sigma factor (sigma-70 family)
LAATDHPNLLEGLRSRDSVAQTAFWRQFWEKTYIICKKIIGKDPDATDVAMDLMISFVDKYVFYLSDPRALWSYLRLMAIRQSLEVQKKKERIAPLEFDIEDTLSKTPEMQAMYSRLLSRLEQCLGHLTPKAQQTLRLKYLGELTNEEIGRRVGGTKQYIGQLIQKSLSALNTCLEKQPGGTADKQRRAMQAETGHVVTLETVEQLLAQRHRYPEDEHAKFLSEMAIVVAGIADKQKMAAFDDHLAVCPICREVMVKHTQIDSTEITLDYSAKSKQEPKSRRIPIAPMAAAAVLILGLTAYFTLAPSHREKISNGTLRIKGVEDHLSVVVQRGAKQFVLSPLDTLKEGDRVAMVYSAERAGFLLIFSRDAEGRATLLHPTTGTESAPIFAGEKIPLKEGGFVEQGTGCEWIIAVFSDEPLDAGSVLRSVEESRTTSKRCGIDTTIPEARSVRITPVLR